MDACRRRVLRAAPSRGTAQSAGAFVARRVASRVQDFAGHKFLSNLPLEYGAV